VFESGYGVKVKDSGGTEVNLASISSTNNYTFGTNISTNFVNVAGGGSVNLAVGGSGIVTTTTTALQPSADNVTTCGGPSPNRWSVVYAVTGTINTSDARIKQQVRDITTAERAVAVRLKALLKAYKFNDAVAAKGNGARIHVGIIAQDVRDAFTAEGLNAHEYGMFCHDEWQVSDEVVADDGTLIKPAVVAGDQYSLRYDELLAFIIAAI
jgi:hypothetical protein